MSSPTPPAAADERIPELDVLRGLAILGILAVNAPAFAMPLEILADPRASPLPFDGMDRGIWWAMRTFFEGKFITLFSLLFGVSVFLVGGERGDPARERVLLRRLLWLGVFGLIHGALIWPGDILLHYALVGLVMSLFRSWRPGELMAGALALLVLSNWRWFEFHLGVQAIPLAAIEGGMRAEVRSSLSAYRGDLAQVQGAVFSDWRAALGPTLVRHGPGTLGLMMLGLGLFKAGVLSGRADRRLYLGFILAGAAALAAIGWAALLQLAGAGPALGLIDFPNAVLSPLVTLGYVALVALGMRRARTRRALGVLRPVGRMAFTNYLTQSLIMTAVFYGGGRGLGWFGRLDWPQWMLLAPAVWALQLVWSALWLSRFTMGPFEWVWRCLSYGRPVPLRRTAVARPALPAA